jgi:hypothetical protein
MPGHPAARVVGGEEPHARGARQRGVVRQALRVVSAPQRVDDEVEVVGEGLAQPREHAREARVRRLRWHRGDRRAAQRLERLVERGLEAGASRAPAAGGDQAREPRMGRAVRGPAQQRRGAGGLDARADHEPHAVLPCRLVGAHDATQRVAVGDRDRREAQFPRARHELVRVGGAAQEVVAGRRLQLGIGRSRARAHAKIPWTNQRPAPSSPPAPSPASRNIQSLAPSSSSTR